MLIAAVVIMLLFPALRFWRGCVGEERLDGKHAHKLNLTTRFSVSSIKSHSLEDIF